MRKDILVAVGASVASAVVASAATWYVTKKAFEEVYEERLGEEVKATIEFLMEQGVSLEEVLVTDETDEELIEKEDILPDLGVSSVLVPDEEDDLERVFGDEDKPSLSSLVANQKVEYHKVLTENDYTETETTEGPPEEDPNFAVVSEDIFMENGTEWPQKTVTYFADGGVLDVEGNFIEDHESLIGRGPYPFGFMSSDQDIVYIRNKKLEEEYEVIRDPGDAADFLAHELQTKFSPEF